MWDIIHRYHALDLSFNSGTSPAEIEMLEESLGCTLPTSLREVYQDHNGTGPWGDAVLWRLLSIAEARALHQKVPHIAWPDDVNWVRRDGRAFWTDDDSGSYAGVWVTGPLRERIFLWDDDPHLTPAYRSVSSFLRAIVEYAESDATEKQWRLMEPEYAQNKGATPAEAASDAAARDVLEELVATSSGEDRTFYARALLALTPFEQTAALLRFLHDEDDAVQRTCLTLLGYRRFEEAIPELIDMALHDDKYYAASSAMLALGLMNTPASREALLHIDRELQFTEHHYIAQLLDGAGRNESWG
jgi:hypothetical protein